MIEIIKEKPIKSSTGVEGILIQVTGGQWYGINRFRAPRNPWISRAAKASTTGVMKFTQESTVFQIRFNSGKPEWDELRTTLMEVLNGAEATIERISY